MLCNQHKLCHERRAGVSSNVQLLPPASVVYSPASTAAHHCSTSACGGKGAFAQPVKATPLSQLSAHRAPASRVITTRATGLWCCGKQLLWQGASAVNLKLTFIKRTVDPLPNCHMSANCTAGSSADVTVPAELPLFPVMPIGVFVPGKEAPSLYA